MNKLLVQNRDKSCPIQIPKSKGCLVKHYNDIYNTVEYNNNTIININVNVNNSSTEKCIKDITLNLFDPNKCSPPNSWNNRLRTRILNM